MLFFYVMSLNSELFANFEALACCYLQQWYRAFTVLVDFEILELLKKDLHNFFLSIVCHFEGCLNDFLNTCMCLMKTWNHKLSFPKRIIEKTFMLFLYKMQLQNKNTQTNRKSPESFSAFFLFIFVIYFNRIILCKFSLSRFYCFQKILDQNSPKIFFEDYSRNFRLILFFHNHWKQLKFTVLWIVSNSIDRVWNEPVLRIIFKLRCRVKFS